MIHPSCKYCGEKMDFVNYGNKKFKFSCPKCGSSSPIKNSYEEAEKAANCNVVQKPLLSSEFLDSSPLDTTDYIWLEYKTESTTYLVPASIYSNGRFCGYNNDIVIIDMINKHNIPFRLKNYNKTWRCWKNKPTQTEIESNLWE